MQVYAEMGISIDTDHAMKAVENAKEIENPSAWKVDVIVYPELFLKNNSLNKQPQPCHRNGTVERWKTDSASCIPHSCQPIWGI